VLEEEGTASYDLEEATKQEKERLEKSGIMRAKNSRVPQTNVKTHKFHTPGDEMYIVCGHSAALSYIMDDELRKEIFRGLWWFYLSLLGGCAVLFALFSWAFERRLQLRVTKPISELSKQIKNPKEFMKERSRATD